MAKSLEVIQKRIAKLQAEADAIKAKEVVGVIARIREAVAHYGLTAEHIFGLNGTEAARGKPANTSGSGAVGRKTAGMSSPIKGTKAPIKYRDSNGNSWSGRGSQPRWLRSAIASGRKIEEFAAKS